MSTGRPTPPDGVATQADPPDQRARDTIAGKLDATLFVEAGAGSGKTKGLVARIGALLLTGTARIEEIAAITFTEAAAAELRDRVAAMLEGEAAAGAQPARAAEALEGLDGAAITTLHGFCRRILAEHPFEAGLPPVFDVCDEARTAVAFQDRWRETLDALVEDPGDARAVQWLLVCGGNLDGLRSMARALGDNWDLLHRGRRRPELPALDAAAVLGPLDAALALAGACTADDDRLLAHLRALAPYADRLRDAAGHSELSLLDAACGRRAKLSAGNLGQGGNWGGSKQEVHELLGTAEEARRALVAGAVHAALDRLCAAVAARVLEAADGRRREGRLEYHDLLVLARDLVRDRPAARSALHRRYRYLLIDEYQDTDPVQAELAFRIAAGEAGAAGGAGEAGVAGEAGAAGEAGQPWSLPAEPGRLFFVGDPLQSIYAFRRADLRLFGRTRKLVPDRVRLTTNFRSVPGVVAWVDAVFATLIGEGDGEDRPTYVGSHPHRPPGGAEVAVTVLGAGQRPAANADEALRREAADVAAVARAVAGEGWPVGDDVPARLVDITVLIPTRRALPALQEAFESAGIPYRLESSSLVFASAEVRDLVAVLRAIDDPTDALAVVASLRSAGFGCGDDELVRYRAAGGSWDYRTAPPPGLPGDADDPVVDGLAWLRRLHEGRHWVDVSALVSRVVEERGLLHLALDDPRWRDGWRRLRFVADQARRFTESVAGGLRGFLDWLDVQAAEDAGVTEVVLPEADQDAVRVMTIHAAKGLEFPVVVVAGLGGERRARSSAVLFGRRGPEVGLRKDLCTAGYPALAQEQTALDREERLRLLYVATTRARDHLVVSVHRSERASGSLAAQLATALASATDAEWSAWDATARATDDPSGRSVPDGAPVDAPSGSPGASVPPAGRAGTRVAWLASEGPEQRAAWLAGRRERLALVPATIPATRVASLATADGAGGATADGAGPGRGAGPADAGVPDAGDGHTGGDGKPGWRRGRAGTAVGRAVHAVLQVVDLATGEGAGELAAAYAEAEGISERTAEVAALVRAALSSCTVRDAVEHGRYWRELYVGVPIGPRVLEGYVDLLVDGPDGLEVVDYKTDQAGEDPDLDDARDRYRLQGAAYALAVSEAVGRPVGRCTFLFLRSTGAVTRTIDDLAAATGEVRRLLIAPGTPAA